MTRKGWSNRATRVLADEIANSQSDDYYKHMAVKAMSYQSADPISALAELIEIDYGSSDCMHGVDYREIAASYLPEHVTAA